MNIAIGADHRGFICKQELQAALTTVSWHDVGAYDQEWSDYPIFARDVCKQIIAGKTQRGILICGSGVGMSIAANRFAGIYAALVWNQEVARLSREHDKSNVLIIPSDFVSLQESVGIVSAWLAAEFLEGHYQKRIDIIDAF